MAPAFTLNDGTFHSPRHATQYWEAGPADGPLMIFLHGWPEIGLVWRAQVEVFACGSHRTSSFCVCASSLKRGMSAQNASWRRLG